MKYNIYRVYNSYLKCQAQQIFTKWIHTGNQHPNIIRISDSPFMSLQSLSSKGNLSWLPTLLINFGCFWTLYKGNHTLYIHGFQTVPRCPGAQQDILNLRETMFNTCYTIPTTKLQYSFQWRLVFVKLHFQ